MFNITRAKTPAISPKRQERVNDTNIKINCTKNNFRGKTYIKSII